jgi:hypothetical protein
LDQDNIEITASLLFEEADILERVNGRNILSFDYYQKSIELNLKLYNETLLEKYCKYIEETIIKLDNYKTKNKIIEIIFQYHCRKMQYGKAEDKLYQLMENNFPYIKDTIMEFYKKIMENDDHILEKGNLPRKEIIEAINALK